jgi:hypothetical protein
MRQTRGNAQKFPKDPELLTQVTSTASAAESSSARSCSISDLTVTLGRGGAAAGTAYRQIDFRNRTTKQCTLNGYPRAVFFNSLGAQVGRSSYRVNVTGQAIKTVILEPGHYANAAIATPTAVNYPPQQCNRKSTANVRVYPLNQRDFVQLPLGVSICTIGPRSDGAFTTPVRAGRSKTAVG